MCKIQIYMYIYIDKVRFSVGLLQTTTKKILENKNAFKKYKGSY